MQLRQELIYSVGHLTFLAFLALICEILSFPVPSPLSGSVTLWWLSANLNSGSQKSWENPSSTIGVVGAMSLNYSRESNLFPFHPVPLGEFLPLSCFWRGAEASQKMTMDCRRPLCREHWGSWFIYPVWGRWRQLLWVCCRDPGLTCAQIRQSSRGNSDQKQLGILTIWVFFVPRQWVLSNILLE